MSSCVTKPVKQKFPADWKFVELEGETRACLPLKDVLALRKLQIKESK